MANLRNSPTAAALSTSAIAAKSLTSVALSTVSRRMHSSLIPRRKISSAKPASSKKWEPVKLHARNTAGLRSTGNACTAAQLLSIAALVLITCAVAAMMLKERLRIAMALTALSVSLILLLMKTLVRVVSSLLDVVFAAPRRWRSLRGLKEFAKSSQLKISQRHTFTKG